jgi:hypothetical protein
VGFSACSITPTLKTFQIWEHFGFLDQRCSRQMSNLFDAPYFMFAPNVYLVFV